MSMKFDDAIEALCEKIEIPDEDHQIFLDDVEIISTQIYEALVKKDSIFKDMFKDLKKTASYQKDDYYDLPNDFGISLILELPFEVEAEIYGHLSRFVHLKTNKNYPIVKDGEISRDLLLYLVHDSLHKIIRKMRPLLCKNGRTYSLKLKPFGTHRRELHQTITAVGGGGATISFKFVPSVKFLFKGSSGTEPKYFVAYPGYDNEFMHREELTQEVEAVHKAKFLHFIRLLKIVYRNFGNTNWPESDFNIKCLYFAILYEKIVIEMHRLKSDLIVEWFGSVFGPNINVELFKKSFEIHSKLVNLQKINAVDMNDLLEMFGLS